MRIKEFITESETIEIPHGKSRRVTDTVPRHWYHNLGGRSMGPNGEILPYTYGKETKIFQDELYRDPVPQAFVYLSPRPLYSGAIKIDASKLDPNLMRLTGQIEGYAVYGGTIPAEAQIKTVDKIKESETPSIGINVRSDGDIDYADLIVDGKKKLETRNTDSLRPYVGRRVAIVRTGRGKAEAIGSVTVGEPIVADEKKFRKLEQYHLVPQGSNFDIKPESTKYLYPMIDPVRFPEPKKVGHGIIGRKVF